MFEKYALCLAQEMPVVIHLIGFPSASTSSGNAQITFHPIFATPFHRVSVSRLLAPMKFLFLCLKLKPEVIIITTHELLLAAVLLKLHGKVKLIYDVQENYYRNIRFGKAFPKVLRTIIAGWVRMKEHLTKSFVDQFVLAEQCYADEMTFMKPVLVIQNKLTDRTISQYQKRQHAGYHRLIFTGTLAETTGILEAIQQFTQLQALDTRFTLTIIGTCHQKKFHQYLLSVIKNNRGIINLISEFPVSHERILEQIQQADVGIIIYPDNPSTQGSIPTKLWEYLALSLPVLIRHNETSHQLVQQYQGGILLDQHPRISTLLKAMEAFQPVQAPLPEDLRWENECRQLIPLLK